MATRRASHSSGRQPTRTRTKTRPVGRRPTLPAEARVKRRADLGRVFSSGIKTADARIRLWVVRNGAGTTRFAVSVNRKHGHAVRRNLLKRRLREAFRLTRHELTPGLDIVCSPQIDAEWTVADVQDSLRRLTAAAATRLGRPPE
ncbi:MAG: Ribonuclease P protein component [Phycisphaerae bacterium]|nr:Ribonuclease P protein component [Phycisphaerae bacterium]